MYCNKGCSIFICCLFLIKIPWFFFLFGFCDFIYNIILNNLNLYNIYIL